MEKTNQVNIYKKRGGLSAFFTAISVVTGILSILIVVYMISLLWDGTSLGRVILLGTAVCLCQIIKAVFYALALWKAHDYAYSSLLEIRLGMIGHLKKLPFSFFQKRKAGDLANIIDRDVERIEIYLAHTLPDVVITNIACVAAFAIVAVLDWRLGIAVISTVPFVFVLMPIFSKLWTKSVEDYQRSIKTVSENVMEYIGAISAIKAFSSEEKKTGKVLQSMYKYIDSARKAIYVQSVPMSLIFLLMEGGIVAVAIAGSAILSRQPVTAWGIIVYILSIILAGQFSKNFSKSMSLEYNKIVFKNTMTAVESVMKVPAEPEKEKHKDPTAGDIEFKDVTFGYDENEKTLKNINVIFKKNSVNAIVGPSGAGKSTMANLMMNFWQPDSGAVTIGGRNVKDFHEQDLSALISIVQQDTFLFNSTVEENIRIGKKDAGREEIVNAAKKAKIHDIIMGFPEGYQTMAGEGGAKLSGGEKQRISIARMILKDAPIVILDEATAAIDPYNEALIQQAIGSLCENKTLIIIAHHLNTIRSADQIIVMQGGELAAKGRHNELLEINSLYKTMVEAERQAEHWNIKEVSGL
ncbi:ABC transporter ATP-binding protein [Ruminiclostridium cellobioparum]|uniref:ABC transporter, permease/ATP-binding protein n=1 Tax=Ruminiclostridium cellobioparum subsp. termitidis CT1112 TaxID=1195236 RepID=S0FQV6_RUMCE|nr:ABC transporter ATP-binding protein [Ruminiclostridium cellobioparum]EMS72756.1 ABC transporter, permease/ATP-binding protein [Ruminiclostridium cellobioparum subsp. termitidis CT1112]